MGSRLLQTAGLTMLTVGAVFFNNIIEDDLALRREYIAKQGSSSVCAQLHEDAREYASFYSFTPDEYTIGAAGLIVGGAGLWTFSRKESKPRVKR